LPWRVSIARVEDQNDAGGGGDFRVRPVVGLGSVDEEQDFRLIGIAGRGRQEDRLFGRVGVARSAVGQKAVVAVGP
jgi:hypothetical protein